MITSMLLSSLLVATAPASAPNPLRLDIEIDPIAYALDGFSLHLGMGTGRYRLDLGAFGLELPEAIHGQRDFRSSFAGYGAKFDVFLHDDGWGPFMGFEGGFTTITIVDTLSSRSAEDRAVSGGVRAGWRIQLPSDFYVTPWVGVGYRFSEDAQIAGRTYQNNPITVFPTFHLGYRF
jgi:hypothetical protein